MGETNRLNNIAGLPNLNNRRLTILQKQLNAHRKSITIINDKLKESLERVEKSVDKRKQSDSFRSWQKSIPVKNSLVEINALKKCLRRRRESSTLEPEMAPRNGVYDGATLDSMKPEVDRLISEKAPAQRRLRKVEKLKNMGYKDGKLVDYQDTMSKLQNVINRPKAKAKRAPINFSPRKALLRQEPHLEPDNYTSSSFEDSDDDGTESEDIVTDMPQKSASASGTRTLQLPPIEARRRQSNYEQSLPSLHGRMRPELPFVRRVSSFGPY